MPPVACRGWLVDPEVDVLNLAQTIQGNALAVDHREVSEAQRLGRGNRNVDVEVSAIEGDRAARKGGPGVQLRDRRIEGGLGATGAGAIADHGIVGAGRR